MKIGIISDTHNSKNIDKAIEIFCNENVEIIIHAGDWTKMSTLISTSELANSNGIKLIGVLGNNDNEIADFIETPQVKKIIKGRIYIFMIEKLKLIVIHGDDKLELEKAIQSNQFDLVITGHTHKLRNEYINKTLVLNPGSVSFSIPRHTNFIPTAMVYDTDEKSVAIISLV